MIFLFYDLSISFIKRSVFIIISCQFYFDMDDFKAKDSSSSMSRLYPMSVNYKSSLV